MAQEPKYWHVGTFTLPEEKKTAFVDDLLKVMNAVGLRKSGTVERNDVSVCVSKPCAVAEDGKIYFDLALCGLEHLALSWIGTDDGQVHLAQEWMDEQCWYALVTVTALQEVYTSTPYYATCRGEIIPIRVFADTIACILKKDPYFPFRDDMARLLAFQYETGVRSQGEGGDGADGWNDWHTVMNRFLHLAGRGCADSFMGLVVAYDGVPEEWTEEGTEFKDRNYVGRIHWLMQAISAGNDMERDRYKDFLDRLSRMPYAKRKELLTTGNLLYRNTAYASLEMHPVSLYAAYAKAGGHDFWKLWAPVAQTAYDDWENRHDRMDDDRPHGQMSPYRFLNILTEHGVGYYDKEQYLCLWDGETELPEYTKEQLDGWKNAYEDTKDDGRDADAASAGFLLHLGSMQSGRNGMHPADAGMVGEFLANMDDPLYRRTLCLWEKDAYGDTEKFPELPPEIVKSRIISQMDGWRTGKRADMFAVLLADHRLRRKYLGF